jgi:hypothetical protein
MVAITSVTERFASFEDTQTVLRADQRMALLAQAFEMELEDAKQDDTPWPMGRTIRFAALVSLALWGVIIAGVFHFI